MRSHRAFFALGFLVLLAACSPATQFEVGAPQSRPSVIAKRLTVTEADDAHRVALAVDDTLAVAKGDKRVGHTPPEHETVMSR